MDSHYSIIESEPINDVEGFTHDKVVDVRPMDLKRLLKTCALGLLIFTALCLPFIPIFGMTIGGEAWCQSPLDGKWCTCLTVAISTEILLLPLAVAVAAAQKYYHQST